MSEIPEALRLADRLDLWGDQGDLLEAAAELRRQHAEITRLRVAVLGQSADLATLRGRNYETQSLLAGAEAERDALRAELVEHKAARNAYASEFPPDHEGKHAVGIILLNIRNLKSERDALRAEVARLTTWQPMETAPMDGTIVLLAYKNALGKLRRVRASYMTRDLIGEYEDDEIERNPGWYERSEAHEEVTETVYPVSYDLLCWTALPALKEAK